MVPLNQSREADKDSGCAFPLWGRISSSKRFKHRRFHDQKG